MFKEVKSLCQKDRKLNHSRNSAHPVSEESKGASNDEKECVSQDGSDEKECASQDSSDEKEALSHHSDDIGLPYLKNFLN